MRVSHYQPLSSCVIAEHEVSCVVSGVVEDPQWDAFLQSSLLGQFQQSSLWARAKLSEGWRPIRLLLSVDGRLGGGFQILGRPSRWGNIGYVSKGPVVELEDPILMDYLVGQMISVAKANKLSALIVQPPDASGLKPELLWRHSFLPNSIVDVISATLLVDLSGGLPEIEKQMRKKTLSQVRRARGLGITLREGTENDISTFFSLMASTCERQKTKPSPATESDLLEVWRAFYPQGRIRLSLAEYEGAPVAGMMCIRFGQRVTAWKKGWSGDYPERYPNQLLTFDAIDWAHRTGGRVLDFLAMNRGIAKDLLSGKPVREDCRNLRDCFNLGFSKQAQLLPESQIYISSPLLRFLYQGVRLVHGGMPL